MDTEANSNDNQRTVAFMLAEVSAAMLMEIVIKSKSVRVLKFLKRRAALVAILKGLRHTWNRKLLCSCLVIVSVLCENEGHLNDLVQLELLQDISKVLLIPVHWLSEYLKEQTTLECVLFAKINKTFLVAVIMYMLFGLLSKQPLFGVDVAVVSAQTKTLMLNTTGLCI